jgi:phage portal protein BeeE
MGWFDRPTRVREAVSTHLRETDPFPGVYTGGGVLPKWSQFQSMHALWAKQVPAFTRGLKLITGTVAQLPLTEWQGTQAVPNPWLAQPEPDEPAWVTMQRTVEDVVLYGRAYWLITKVDNGRPVAIEHLDYAEATRQERPDPAPDLIGVGDEGLWPIADPRYNRCSPNTVIEFRGYREGVLVTGVDTISTALALELTTRNQADVPMPSQILKNTSNYELDPTEVTELIRAYTEARQTSSVAYLNGGVELDTLGWSAQEMALEPQRNQSAIQIARLLNLDPSFVGASTSGSSLTYTNREDLRRDLIDLTLSDYLTPIEQRLSMRDLTDGMVRFDTAEFVRSNLDARVNMVNILVPLGVMSTDEARAFLTTSPTNGGAFS